MGAGAEGNVAIAFAVEIDLVGVGAD